MHGMPRTKSSDSGAPELSIASVAGFVECAFFILWMLIRQFVQTTQSGPARHMTERYKKRNGQRMID
jgi:hypothetical protein